MGNNKSEIIKLLSDNKAIEIFDKFYINTVMIFGSIVTEEFTEDSDVDIAILAKRELNINDILSLEELFEQKLSREIDIIDLKNDNTELSIKVTIFDDGEIIYNNDKLEVYKQEYRNTEVIYKNNETFRHFRERDVIWDE